MSAVFEPDGSSGFHNAHKDKRDYGSRGSKKTFGYQFFGCKGYDADLELYIPRLWIDQFLYGKNIYVHVWIRGGR